MRQIPAQLLADLQSDSTSIAFLWHIKLSDGRYIRGTEHDQDITLPATGSSPADPNAGTYYAIANITLGDITNSTDLSVGNLDVTGAASNTGYDSSGRATVLDVSIDDIEAGLLDQAPVTIIICNWRAPSHGYFIPKVGSLGAIKYDSDGKYVTEVRGLPQQLAQTIIRTFSASCNVVTFGDIRCGFNVAGATITGEVAANTANNQIEFEVSLNPGSPANGFSYRGGTLTFTSGANEGFARELKIDPNANSGIAQFWEQFPAAINPGDAFTLSPGCDRQPATCKVYGRFVPSETDPGGWKGYGLYIPGVNALTAGPTTTGELD